MIESRKLRHGDICTTYYNGRKISQLDTSEGRAATPGPILFHDPVCDHKLAGHDSHVLLPYIDCAQTTPVEYIVISPTGRPLHTLRSLRELSGVKLGAIAGHRSLLVDGKILRRELAGRGAWKRGVLS